ncbi:MAG: BNR-4 repeat-containing protein, partial [Armatimonadetes bacterium]|nr:BNR-4 repeat-containing protein [Armatimonadota bacterium]
NRPVIRQRTENKYLSTGLMFHEDGRWVERSFVEALRAVYPTYRGTYFGAGFWGAKVVFDGQGDAYTLVRAMIEGGGRSILLHTADRGRSYTVHELPDGSFNHEQFSGHNALSEPPPILVHQQTADFPGDYAQVNDLWLLLPRKVAGGLELGEPVLVSRRDLGPCQHSGAPAATATRDGKTHIVWGEVTEEKVPGVPTFVATFDHATRQLSPKLLLGYAPPVNDVHNAPGICQDSQGYLHMVSGSHGDAFWYRRSLRPNDASGWTPAEPVLTAGSRDAQSDADGTGRQTYLSLLCGPDDTLHIAYRQWRQGVDSHHGGANYAALSYQRKPAGGPWSAARPLVVPVRPGYSIYYHKLTIDRRGRLFLAYGYLTQDATYQADFPEQYHDPAVLVSADAGETWKLAETADLVGVAR